MIPDYWTLKDWARKLGVLAYLLFAVGMVLERARRSAEQVAEREVEHHRWNCHPDEMEDDL